MTVKQWTIIFVHIGVIDCRGGGNQFLSHRYLRGDVLLTPRELGANQAVI